MKSNVMEKNQKKKKKIANDHRNEILYNENVNNIFMVHSRSGSQMCLLFHFVNITLQFFLSINPIN